jgi:pimeloyl-ACP methyl ester carboxylesterase
MTQPTRSLVVPTTMGRLHVQDSGPVGGTVALLWPSLFTDGLTSWGAQLSGLHDLGWRTLLIDPPGTGGSPPAPQLFTMEECAQAAIHTLDIAEAARAALLGLSLGGFVALRVALTAPQRVVALVLQGTSGTGRVRRIGTSEELSQQQPRARRGRSSCRDALRLRRAAGLRSRSSGSTSGTVAVGASNRGHGWAVSAVNTAVT